MIPNDPAIEAAIRLGERRFVDIGCTTCHIPKLPLTDGGWIFTEPSPYNPPGNRRPADGPVFSVDLTNPHLPSPRLRPDGAVVYVPAFTDLRLHDICDGPDDPNIEPREGKLYFIDNALQPGSGTVKLRAETPNPDHALWPAQFARVRLVLDLLKDAMLVPSSAVQIGQNGPFVFVLKQDSTLELRKVKPGQAQGDLTVISEGLKPGESVVTSGQLQLSPGMKVNAQEMNPGGPGKQAPPTFR